MEENFLTKDYSPTVNYDIPQEEVFWSGEETSKTIIKDIIWKLKDGSRYSYKGSVFKDEKERIRAHFLVKLIDNYNYKEEDIQLDVETIKGQKVDILVYKNNFPYIAADCLKDNISDTEIEAVKKELINKAIFLEVDYAVLIIGSKRIVFNLKDSQKIVFDFPGNIRKIF